MAWGGGRLVQIATIPLVAGRANYMVLVADPRRHDGGDDRLILGGQNIDDGQLITDILALETRTTCEQVHATLLHISGKLGFDGFLYRGRFQASGAPSASVVESNYNPSWRQRYEDQLFVQIDPTVSHALSSLSPLIWSDAMYASEVQQRFRDEARQYGLVEGITFPVHRRTGNCGLLSLSLSRSDEAACKHLRATLTWGTFLASMTHEAMSRIVKRRSNVKSPKLTPREAEVLGWIAKGKSNWEIARLVDISEHGVSYHVRNILAKFEVGCRHRALAQAQALGLIQQS